MTSKTFQRIARACDNALNKHVVAMLPANSEGLNPTTMWAGGTPGRIGKAGFHETVSGLDFAVWIIAYDEDLPKDRAFYFGRAIVRPTAVLGDKNDGVEFDLSRYDLSYERALAVFAEKVSGQYVDAQVDSDTCEEHGKFCCAECFDVSIPDESPDPGWMND